MILLLKSYPYHFVRTILSVPFCPIPFCPYTILSNTILSVYHFVHTILSVPFCPLPFCPRTLRYNVYTWINLGFYAICHCTVFYMYVFYKICKRLTFNIGQFETLLNP